MFPSNPPARRHAPPPLRPYQLAALRAILRSITENAGRTIVVEMARQAGKNELQVRLEALLLAARSDTGGTIVKCAPTMEPQLRTSFRRLDDYLTQDGIPHNSAWPRISIGRAALELRSAEKSASVAGATADILLEVDEAQDVDPDTYQRRFRPMASTTNATTAIYGTAWSELDLLQTTIASNRELTRKDMIQRNFITRADDVAFLVPAYANFLNNERARLGADHPLITTEYDLIPLAGAGRLFTPDQITQLHGTHIALSGPVATDNYVGGLDLGGEDTGSDRPHDRTVLTIARIERADAAQAIAGAVPAHVVHHHAARGMPHAEQIPQLVDILKTWNVRAIVVDATGIGEATAALIARALPRVTVELFKFTQQSKSELGFGLITATNVGALKLYADNNEHRRELDHELAHARRDIRANKTMNFYVNEADGNDDYLISLALLARAATQHEPRRAVGR